MKTNLLSSIYNKPIQTNSIEEAYHNLHPNSNLGFTSNVSVSAKFWAELAIGHNHVNKHSNISKLLLTGDTIQALSKSNPFPDCLLDLTSIFGQRRVHADIKTGTGMTKEPLKGTIGQLTYDGDEQIYIPNQSIIDLKRFNEDRLEMLKKREFEILITMPSDQKQVFKNQLQECISIIENNVDSLIEKHNKIEKYLYTIQSLPNLNKGISFINIVHIRTNQVISEEELSFIQNVMPHINPNVFSNERTLKVFLVKALKIYSEQHTSDVKEMCKLKDSPWTPSFIDEMSFDVFK